jgi:hypothetical protein
MSYYCIQITFDGETQGSVETWEMKNATADQLQRLRNLVFTDGIAVPNKEFPGTEYEIISPFRIRKFYVTMQQKKFE